MRNGFLAILGVGAVAIAVGSGAKAQDRAPVSSPKPISIKLEWVSSVPRATENVTLLVDQGYTAATTQGGRSVKVGSTLNADKTVTVNLRITGPSKESIETELTTQPGETRVVQAVVTRKGKESTERLLFVTATPQE